MAPNKTHKLHPVYIRLPYFGQVSEQFTHRLSTEIENVYRIIKLRPVFRTIKSLSGTNEDITHAYEKENNIIYKFNCYRGSGYVGKSSQKFHLRQNQHVPKTIKKWMAGGEKPEKIYFYSIGNHFWITHIVQ